MKSNRRRFLQLAGTVSAGTLMFPHLSCNNTSSKEMKDNASTTQPSPPPVPALKKFGIQLYSLRDDMPKDPKGVLKKVADYGYRQIESYEGEMGMFWDMPHMDFKKYLDDLGLEMVASHCNINENFEEKAAQAAEVGMSYLIIPGLLPPKTVDEWKKHCDQFKTLWRNLQ